MSATTIEQKLNKFVRRSGADDCWPWTGQKDEDGYGRLKMTRAGTATRIGAHKAAYEVAFGKIPGGLLCLHDCDNPACCNPKHLYVGTQAQNVQDSVARGRRARGERIASSKLTTAQVVAIRLDDRSQRAIARDYGMDKKTIKQIRCRELWRHVA